jgi:RNA polymerase sigma factor (sigma-70 family)
MRRVSMDALDFDKKIAELSFDAENNSELIEKVKKIMAKIIRNELTPRQRQTVSLYYYEGKGVTEIAQMLDLDVSTVSRTIKRARERIYKFLKYYFV